MTDLNSVTPATGKGGSPFEQIRRLDAYGREYWTGRELQPLMEYTRWQTFQDVIEKAKASLELVSGQDAAERAFQQFSEVTHAGNLGAKTKHDYRLTRFGAYLTAMAGDDQKQAVAEARVYFAVRTREAELGAITEAEKRDTALARAREMTDYKVFRDMMAENATDYRPSSRETGIFFGMMQNQIYRHIVGMDANEIKKAREIYHWPGREEGKGEPGPKSQHRKVAKNYLTLSELGKLERLVARLCLRAQDIAEDGTSLTMSQWLALVDQELALLARPIAS